MTHYNLSKIYIKLKAQKILAEGYDKLDIPQIFELFKSPDKSNHELAMQMLYGKDDNGNPNFNPQDVEYYAQQLFGVITRATGENWKDLINIDSLNIEGKKLLFIPIAVKWLSNLVELFLNHNKLTQIPDNAFEGLTNLELLELNYNQLIQIPSKAFTGLSNLQTLDLGSNQITQIPINAFENLTNLKAIWLYNNKLTQISDNAFAGLTNLQTLGLEDNKLTELSSNVFSKLPNLQTLWLHGNLLTQISPNTFIKLPKLQTLSLKGNPIPQKQIENLRKQLPNVQIT